MPMQKESDYEDKGIFSPEFAPEPQQRFPRVKKVKVDRTTMLSGRYIKNALGNSGKLIISRPIISKPSRPTSQSFLLPSIPIG